MMALDLPPWFFKCVDKLRRGFFWKGVEDARLLPHRMEHCLPAKPYGGLGVLNLPLLNQALRIRWRWFKKTVLDKPWAGLQLSLLPISEHLARAALKCQLGDGKAMSFWHDPWIDGCSPAMLAPHLLEFVRPAARRIASRTPSLAMNGWRTFVVRLLSQLSLNSSSFGNAWMGPRSLLSRTLSPGGSVWLAGTLRAPPTLLSSSAENSRHART